MNAMFQKFLPISVCDSHHHIERRDDADATVENYRQLLEFFGYDRILLLGIPDFAEPNKIPDPLNCIKSLYVKHRLQPRVYAFSSLLHYYDERDTAEELLSQLKRAWEMGFDGMKLFNQKPSLRKKTGIPLDGDTFDPFFAYAEENEIPLTLHISDPSYHWDGSESNPYLQMMLERGWLFDETYPTRRQLFSEVNGVMRRHPHLRVCVAHMMCDGDDVENASRFLADYPNTAYDLTPCPSEFAITSRDPKAWREFFLRFADRLHYGTDMRNAPFCEDGLPHAWGLDSAILSRMYLEGTEPFVFGGDTYTPLCLPRDVITRICRDNFFTRLGERPRRVVPELAIAECQRLERALQNNDYGIALGEYEALEYHNLTAMQQGFCEA